MKSVELEVTINAAATLAHRLAVPISLCEVLGCFGSSIVADAEKSWPHQAVRPDTLPSRSPLLVCRIILEPRYLFLFILIARMHILYRSVQ